MAALEQHEWGRIWKHCVYLYLQECVLSEEDRLEKDGTLVVRNGEFSGF